MKSSKNANSKRPNFPPDFDPLVYGKVEPNAKELEGAVLGAIMLEKGAFDAVSKVLRPESFYVDANRVIYGAMIELAKRSQPIDILTVTEQLKSEDKLEGVGGMFYVTKLTNAVVSSANIEAHAEIIQRKHLLRQQIRIYSQAIHECFDPGADGMDLLDQTGGKIMELSVQSQRGEVTSIGDELIRTAQKIEELRISGDDVTGVTSGFVSVDKVTTGWQAPDLIILAARPSVGKTALALCLARNAALNKKKPVSVALFSMEMNKQQITQRLLSAESEIYLERIRKGKLEEHDMKKLYVTGIQPLSNARILMDETGALNIFELRAKCRQLKASDDIGLIIIDYLQLMSGVGDGRPQNREQEIAGISRGLKALAKELNVPIIALSQLSREADGVVPSLKMLRESGSIEQDADVVCFITRESYQKVEEEVDPALRHTVTLHFRKNRQGTLDDVPLYAVMEIQKFMEEEAYNKYQRRTDPLPASYIPISEASGPKLYIMPPTGTDGDGPF